MRSLKLGGLACLALFLATASGRAEEKSPWTPFVEADVLAVGNAGKHSRTAASGLCNFALAQGAATCGSAVSAYGAYGGRLGLFYNIAGVDAGASLGYLYGGPTAVRGNYFVTPAGRYTVDTIDDTIRLLAEFSQKYELNEVWNAAVGAGMGWALDHEHTTCNATGTFGSGCVGQPTGLNTGWMTWEVTQAFLARGFELGVRYVGFARRGYFPWNTASGFVGYRFQ